MKKKITIITSVVSLVLIVALVITLIIVKKDDDYNYPNVIPKISNPNDVYVQVGDVKITREQMYHRTLSNYGLVTINDLIDDLILPNIDPASADFLAYKDKAVSKYLGIEIDELNQEKWDEFYEDMILQGQMSKEASDKYIELDYRRYLYAKEKLAEDVENFEPIKDDDGEITQEKYFSEIQYETTQEVLFPQEAQVVVITFRSEQEAKTMLDELGIKVSNLHGWLKKSNGEPLTKGEIYNAFVEMYNSVYQYRGSTIDIDSELNISVVSLDNEYAKLDHTFKTLSEISSVIAGKVFNILSTEKTLIHQYTTAPQSYLSGYYLALKVTSNELTEEELAEKDDEVLEYLIENAINTSLTNRYLYKMRYDAGVKIFDEGLENNFTSAINSTLSSLKDYEQYEKTTDTDGVNILSLTANGSTKYITADQLYDELIVRYGVQSSVSFMNQYIVLDDAYSDVYNYKQSKILDQEEYDEYYKEVSNTKKELEKGTYAANGFHKKYGFDNYLRDLYGYLTPLEVLLGGTVYDVAVTQFAKNSYVFENEYVNEMYDLFKDWYAKIDEKNQQESDAFKNWYDDLDEADKNLSDNELREKYITHSYQIFIEKFDKILDEHPEVERTVKYQIIKKYLDYFNVNGFMIGYYVDFNDDRKADDLADYANIQDLGEELIDALIAKAYLEDTKGNSFSEKLRKLITEYNIASINDNEYGKYKKAGILINITDASNYTNSNVENDNLKDVLKTKWNRVRDAFDYEQDDQGQPTETVIKFGTTQSTVTANQALKYTWDTDKPSVVDEYFEMDYIYNRFISLNVTNATWFSYVQTSSVTNKNLIPNNYESYIKLYNINQKTDEEKTAEEIEYEKETDALQTYMKNWITFYYVPIVQEFEGEDALSRSFASTRQALIDDQTIKFTDANDAVIYERIMDLLLAEE